MPVRSSNEQIHVQIKSFFVDLAIFLLVAHVRYLDGKKSTFNALAVPYLSLY